MDDYEEIDYQQSPKDGKLLRNMALASLAVGLVLTLILDVDSIRGPHSGGNATNFALLFISSVVGKALAFMIVPLVMLGVARIYSYVFNKSRSKMSNALGIVWGILTSISIAGLLMHK